MRRCRRLARAGIHLPVPSPPFPAFPTDGGWRPLRRDRGPMFRGFLSFDADVTAERAAEIGG